MRLYDAHNHLQDDRLKPWRDEWLAQAASVGVVRMVVNGACEEDWPDVTALARQSRLVLPSFGYHPWYVHERTQDWQRRLTEYLDAIPSAIGEIGLDRWILERRRQSERVRSSGDALPFAASLEEQADVFRWQLQLAAKRNRPVSIHCLRAWGLMHDILRQESRPACGFLLHSYGGPVELVKPLVDLGAYFSLPGYFAQERKQRQREVFKHIPRDRLLVETDAPDQCLPDDLNRFPLMDPVAGRPLNHPANLVAVYAFAADLFGESIEKLADQLETNFQCLFGTVANG